MLGKGVGCALEGRGAGAEGGLPDEGAQLGAVGGLGAAGGRVGCALGAWEGAPGGGAEERRFGEEVLRHGWLGVWR